MDAARGTKIHVLQNCEIPFGRNVPRSDVIEDKLHAAGRHLRAMAIADERMNDFEKIRTDRHKRPFVRLKCAVPSPAIASVSRG